MKKTLITLGLFASFGALAQSNVGIGTLNPNNNAILEIKSDDKGILISRLTTVARNTLGTALTANEDGMLVYDKDLKVFYYWDGAALAWVQVGSGTGDNWGTQVVQTSGSNISGDGTTANPLMVTDADSDPNNEIELPTGGTNGQVLSTDGSGNYTWVADNAGTDDQNIANLAFDNTTNILTVGIENGTSQTIDLSALLNDADSDPNNEIELPTGGTNGQVLSTDGSGNYTWITDNAGTDDQNISGSGLSGTTLTIGIENGNNETVDLSTLVDHDWYKVGTTSAPTTINDNIFTQGNVGIQESAPTNLLSIGANLGTGYGLTVNPNTQYGQVIQTTESPATSNPAFWVRTDDGGTISHLFRVQNNGNVGIGTVNPQRALHIVGTGGISDDVIFESNTNTPNVSSLLTLWRSRGTNGSKLAVQNNDLLGVMDARGWNGSSWVSAAGISIQAKNNFSSSVDGSFSIFTTNNGSQSTKMIVLPNGNVGIGTTAPSGPLHIRTLVDAGPNSPNDAASFMIGSYTSDHIEVDENEIAFMKGNVLNTTTYCSINAGTLVLQAEAGATNVGINTITPTAKLDINGDLRIRTTTAGASTDQTLVVDVNGVVKKVAPYVPPGMVNAFAGSTAPAGYLLCNGAAVSRTTYANLFAVIGTTYGAGNGTTTFNLPDLRGEFIRGFDAGRGVDNGRTLGSWQKGSLGVGDDGNNLNCLNNAGSGFPNNGYDAISTAQLQSIYPNSRDIVSQPSSQVGYYYNLGANTYFGVSRPRNIAMNYCIKF